jgi:heptosyltransferase III
MDSVKNHPSFRGIKKILIVKLKNIGDVLLTTPCIRALHDSFPQAQISALVNEGTEPMLTLHPLLEEVIKFPRSEIKGSIFRRMDGELSFLKEIRSRHFDMVVDLTSGDRAAWYAWFSGARYRLAHDPQGKGFLGKRLLYSHVAPYPKNSNIHEVAKNLSVLEALGIKTTSPKLEMHFSEEDRRAVQTRLVSCGSPATFALVHPTSRWLFKCWEDSRFAELIDWIQTQLNLPVIMTCGPDEKEIERAQKVLKLCKSNPVTILGELSLKQWAALVKQAKFFIGVDSAPMHIAASQGIPSIALFGPTGHQNWRPWAVEHQLLVHDCPCSKDRQEHCDWKQTRACMLAITLDEVKTAVGAISPRSTGEGVDRSTSGVQVRKNRGQSGWWIQ